MRDESEVKQKYHQLLGRNLEKAFQKKLGKKPHNCLHNHVHSYLNNKDNMIVVDHVGLCMLNSEDPSSWEGNICETVADARFCQYFSPRYNKQDIYVEFMEKISDPEVLQHEFRDMYMLRWVLGEEANLPKLSFLDKIKFWISNQEWANFRFGKSSLDNEENVEELTKKLFPEDGN